VILIAIREAPPQNNPPPFPTGRAHAGSRFVLLWASNDG
jgi:hypothetical protein